MRSVLLPAIALLGLLTLAACDEPAPWARAVAPQAQAAVLAKPRPQAVTWNEAQAAFELKGAPLHAGRLWTFDGSTEGFVPVSGDVLPKTPVGMDLWNTAPDAALRSPKGLALDGARYSLVLVRLTRLRPSADWDGALFYTTTAHGESGDFQAKPIEGAEPAVNETVILVYDMKRLKKGGDDWANSLVDQIRLDTDNQAGGAFTIHQVAITENPGPEALGEEVAATAAAKPVAVAAR